MSLHRRIQAAGGMKVANQRNLRHEECRAQRDRRAPSGGKQEAPRQPTLLARKAEDEVCSPVGRAPLEARKWSLSWSLGGPFGPMQLSSQDLALGPGLELLLTGPLEAHGSSRGPGARSPLRGGSSGVQPKADLGTAAQQGLRSPAWAQDRCWRFHRSVPAAFLPEGHCALLISAPCQTHLLVAGGWRGGRQ